MTRVGILVSGTGSNMVALVRAMQDGRVPAEPALVLSNRPEAPGLARAQTLGVPTAVVDHRAHDGRESFDAAMGRALDDAGIELVACAGFMRIMTDGFVQRWQGRMLNVHPSLLPLFKGLHTHARALAAGVAVHGATVHEVVPELDSGTILGQAVVRVRPGDDAHSLAARVLAREHLLYPAALAAFVSDPERARAEPIALFPD